MNFKKYLNNQNKLKSPIIDMVSSHVKHIVETDINYLINERVIQHEDRTKAALATISKDLEQVKALFKEILDKEQETPQEALNKIQDAKEQEIKKLVNLKDPTLEAGTLVHKALEDYRKHQQIQRIITEELNIK